jgi:hypothetical protein
MSTLLLLQVTAEPCLLRLSHYYIWNPCRYFQQEWIQFLDGNIDRKEFIIQSSQLSMIYVGTFIHYCTVDVQYRSIGPPHGRPAYIVAIITLLFILFHCS